MSKNRKRRRRPLKVITKPQLNSFGEFEKLKFGIYNRWEEVDPERIFDPVSMGRVGHVVGLLLGTEVSIYNVEEVNREIEFIPHCSDIIHSCGAELFGKETIHIVNCLGLVAQSMKLYEWGAIVVFSLGHSAIGKLPILLNEIKNSNPSEYHELKRISDQVSRFHSRAGYVNIQEIREEIKKKNEAVRMLQTRINILKGKNEFLVGLYSQESSRKKKSKSFKKKRNHLFDDSGYPYINQDISHTFSDLGYDLMPSQMAGEEVLVVKKDSADSNFDIYSDTPNYEARLRDISHVFEFMNDLIDDYAEKLSEHKKDIKHYKEKLRVCSTTIEKNQETARRMSKKYIRLEKDTTTRFLNRHNKIYNEFLEYISHSIPSIDVSSTEKPRIKFAYFMGSESSTMMKRKDRIKSDIINKSRGSFKKNVQFICGDDYVGEENFVAVNIRVCPDLAFSSRHDGVMIYGIKDDEYDDIFEIMRNERNGMEERFMSVKQLIGIVSKRSEEKTMNKMNKIESEVKKVKSEVKKIKSDVKKIERNMKKLEKAQIKTNKKMDSGFQNLERLILSLNPSINNKRIRKKSKGTKKTNDDDYDTTDEEYDEGTETEESEDEEERRRIVAKKKRKKRKKKPNVPQFRTGTQSKGKSRSRSRNKKKSIRKSSTNSKRLKENVFGGD